MTENEEKNVIPTFFLHQDTNRVENIEYFVNPTLGTGGEGEGKL